MELACNHCVTAFYNNKRRAGNSQLQKATILLKTEAIMTYPHTKILASSPDYSSEF